MRAMTGGEISRAVLEMKRQSKKLKSNVYARQDQAKSYDAVCTPETLAYLENDHGVDRLYFYTTSGRDLQEVLSAISRPVTVDIVTRDEEEFSGELREAGFSVLARMRRLVNRDISTLMKTIKPSSLGGVALREDTEAINRKLWATFDTRISHLLSDRELAASIAKGEVLIVKERGSIITILQRSLDRRQFYINQVINEGESSYIHGLMGSELREFYDSGGRYMYAWVQDTNIASNKFHAKYGMRFDGLYDLIYVNQ